MIHYKKHRTILFLFSAGDDDQIIDYIIFLSAGEAPWKGLPLHGYAFGLCAQVSKNYSSTNIVSLDQSYSILHLVLFFFLRKFF